MLNCLLWWHCDSDISARVLPTCLPPQGDLFLTFPQVLPSIIHPGDARWMAPTALPLRCHHAEGHQLLRALPAHHAAPGAASPGLPVSVRFRTSHTWQWGKGLHCFIGTPSKRLIASLEPWNSTDSIDRESMRDVLVEHMVRYCSAWRPYEKVHISSSFQALVQRADRFVAVSAEPAKLGGGK